MHLRKYTNQKTPVHFNKSEFDHIVNQYENSDLTYRINHVIIKNAKKNGAKYSFYLDWPDSLKQNHLLKITFSSTDAFKEKFNSWIMDEKTLFQYFYKNKIFDPEKQHYYSMRVKEVISKNQENDILNIWLATDGLVGELYDLKKGNDLSGNDVLAIYQYFDRFFKIKNTLICDESRLANKEDTVRIPLRLIYSLCSNKTWYETKLCGIKLFECHQLKSAYEGIVTQHHETRNHALKDLQNMSLGNWFDMLDEASKEKLLKIFFSASSSLPHCFDETTLKELTTYLFKNAKEKQMITSSLKKLVDLLCDKMHWDEEIVPNPNDQDFWVKSRVKEVLWGGYFWIKEAATEPTTYRP